MTGIQVSQNGGRGQQASIFVRGANSDQILILIDGIRFARAAKGSVDFSQLPITFVERVEYVRGARASVYGSEAIGGVINIVTYANSENETTKVSAGLGSRDYEELSFVTGLKVGENGHLNLSVGYDADEGYNVHPMEGINDGDLHGFESRNALIGYVHNFDEQWSAFANYRIFENFSQYDGSYIDFYTGEPVHSYKESEVDNSTIASGVRFRSEKLSSDLLVNYQNQEDWNYEKSLGRSSGSSDELEQTNVQWFGSYQVNKTLVANVGIDWRDEAYIVKTTGSEYDRTNTAYFAGLNLDSDKMFGELSIRLDDNEQFGAETTYNTGIGYRFGEWLVAKAAYGTAFKAPNLYQLYSYYGNPDLEAEKADSVELTLSGLIEGIEWSVTGYDTNVEDLIDYNYSTSKYYNTEGESQLRGLELVTAFDTAFVSHNLSADFKQPEDQSGEQLIRRAEKMFKYNATAQLDEFDISLGYQYVGERPDFSEDLDAYGVFDAAINYQANDHLTLNGRIENLTDEEYETAAGYPSPERGYYINAVYQF